MTTHSSLGLVDLLCWLVLVPLLAYLAYRTFINSDDRLLLVVKWIVTVMLVRLILYIASWQVAWKPICIVPPAFALGILWTSNVCNVLFRPLLSAFDGGNEEVETKPYYFLAEGKRRKGLFEEAAAEVRKELEKFPGDAEGMMRLAAIQANDLHDLPAATDTLNQLLTQPDLPPGKAVAALQTLADWQMNIGRDPAAARASFERIIQMFPDSSFSHAAEQRLAHLEGVTQTRDIREKSVFKVPTRERDLGLRQTALQPEPPEVEADALAAEYVAQLEKHPNDTETREKLALLYAAEFDRLDLAISQLEQLTALPNETTQHIARWLDLMATLHIRHGHDLESAESALRRIIERFPKTASATRAMERLATLQGEWKAAALTTVAKPLGVYEKDLGLKAGSSIRL